VDENRAEESLNKATEIRERYGDAIVDGCIDLYHEEPTAIGVALHYYDCGCLTLQGFDENAGVVGILKVLGDKESCTISHTAGEVSGNAIYKSVVWKDSQEEFDRRYGNIKRIEIANKLFPPPVKE
jgi:hypothetical protein